MCLCTKFIGKKQMLLSCALHAVAEEFFGGKQNKRKQNNNNITRMRKKGPLLWHCAILQEQICIVMDQELVTIFSTGTYVGVFLASCLCWSPWVKKIVERMITFIIPTRLPDHPFSAICIIIFQPLSEELYSLLLMMWHDTPTSGKGLEHTKSMSIKMLIKNTQMLW